MTDDDPNETYEVVPTESGPHGPPKGWWTVKRNGLPARKRPSDTRPILNIEQVSSPGRLGRRRRGSDPVRVPRISLNDDKSPLIGFSIPALVVGSLPQRLVVRLLLYADARSALAYDQE